MLLEIDQAIGTPVSVARHAAARDRSLCETCNFRSVNFCGAAFGAAPDGDVVVRRYRTAAARHNIYRAGEPTEGALVICEGWAVRFIQLGNGKRQILSVLMPGDLVSSAHLLERSFPFSIQAVTKVKYGYLPFDEIRSRLRTDPTLVGRWIELTTAERSSGDRQLVELGQRAAQERVVALIVQIMQRCEARGELKNDVFPLPLSQQQIADFTGLTPVHTCRVLSVLRKNGLCDVTRGTVKVLDRTELQRMGALR